MVPNEQSYLLIGVPRDERALAKAIGEAHRRNTRMRDFSDGVRGYLFQVRFSSCVLDEPHFLAAARYVELNPVHDRGVFDMLSLHRWFSVGLSQRSRHPPHQDGK